MTNLQGKKILLGITGGIAACKSAELVRLLNSAQASVRVCMTPSATEFISPLTMQALSGNAVHREMFDEAAEAAMGHIELARWADLVVIAPATANTLAKIAHGQADNLLTTLCLASKAPLVVAPAMNRAMWSHAITQANIERLRRFGVTMVGPDSGSQACGDIGPGRMSEPAVIMQELLAKFSASVNGKLAGIKIMITAGPTREAIDPVRYITNRSSGKMGYAIAAAALQTGAKVTLVSGPVNLQPPAGAKVLKVESAQQMFEAVQQNIKEQQIFIATAAVADYAAASVSASKIKKQAGKNSLTLDLKKNPDILAETSLNNPGLFTVGFAAETDNVIEYARGKLEAKHLDMIAANQVGQHQGFDQDDNALEVIWADGQQSLPQADKHELARQLMEIISQRYEAES